MWFQDEYSDSKSSTGEMLRVADSDMPEDSIVKHGQSFKLLAVLLQDCHELPYPRQETEADIVIIRDGKSVLFVSLKKGAKKDRKLITFGRSFKWA